jgi:CSLREA domain-containing protein
MPLSYPFFSHTALLALLLTPPAASAMDIWVSKTSDSLDGACNADCSLREAVVLANATAGVQRIRLAAGTYALTLATPRGEEGYVLDEDENLHGDLDITGTLKIIGAGSANSFIDGSQNDRILEVLSGASLRLCGLTLQNGFTSTAGGALLNHGHSVLEHVHLQNNRASYGFHGGEGGAISNLGTLKAYWTQFHNNVASFGDSGHAYGGALFNQGDVIVRDSLFHNNFARTDDVVSMGGALFNIGSADIARSVFLHHGADGLGTTIRNDGNGVLKLTNVTVSGKSGGGEGDLGATVANGANYPRFAGVPSLQLTNVTIADNKNLGLINYGKLLIRNSLIAGNINSSGDSANCHNGGSTYSYQARGLLLGNGAGNCTADLYIENADTFIRLIYPLADNNSTLPTHALRKGSVAVDAGIGSCTKHDQRRLDRPRDGDGDGIATCDLGAYERAKP